MAATEEEQRRRLVECFERAGLTLEQLWMRYFALGGDVGLLELDAYLNGVMVLPRVQRDMVAHAVNERLDELVGRNRVPYSSPVRQSRPARGPLAALVSLLEGAHRAPPERLPAIMDAAGETLDLRVGVYLADYAQCTLVPIGGTGRRPVPVENTPAGEAFQRGDLVVTDEQDGPRLWAALLDGVERLGVLEVAPTDGTDPRDPLLREQVRWLAYLFGHLVTITTQYGDGLDRARRREHRGPVTELLWSALPPFTVATESVTIAAAAEPADDLTSDVFDYALSESSVSFAVFDAGAGEPTAALSAVVALSAYRAARRDGLGLETQARAVDEAVAGLGNGAVRGVLGEFDVATGRVSYVVAGHPPLPLLLRQGKVAGPLAEGRAAPFGGGGRWTVAAEELRPGDVLVLYTDGIVAARDRQGAAFGFSGLAEVLEREVPDGLLPEAARRVTQAVLAHRAGALAEDATIVLLRPFGNEQASRWF
ncbi:PP2C family protein-serine/threonine phosphatase [Amycolatopsis sp. NPDC026612]|uniref:PP2C family protein-serine/threonine phosphatase n=1 Tax=Amycolatopsis sp. NPDC026612 TaxID=3155466 RepID=UPI0033EB5786